MATVRKRASDAARGKVGKWTCFYVDRDGKRRSFTGTTDKAKSQDLANAREARERLIREGIVDPGQEARTEASRRPLADHVKDFADTLKAQDNTATYCRSRASTVRRLLEDAAVGSLADLTRDRILAGLAIWKGRGRSARTLNDALGAVKEFAGWLVDADRIPIVPKGLKRVARFNEDADRRLVRRALTRDELARLLDAAERGATLAREAPTIPRPKGSGRGGWGQKGRARKVPITGPDRAALYRAAMATGYRANELRSLTRESFRLDGPEPAIVLDAKHTKNGRDADQPITREIADALRPAVEAAAPGARVLVVPEKTAKLLRIDLKAAGIPFRTAEGVCDFHALRHSFITHLVESGASPKVVQALARHSDIRLTLDRYTTLRDGAKRDAIEGGK